MKYTRNNDPKYFINNPTEGNCGSFALNIKEWYISDRDWDNFEVVHKMVEDGYDLEEIFDYLTFINVKTILEDFDDVRTLLDKNDVQPDEELIAYRIGIFWDEDFEEYDTDFHFRVRRDGVWMDKPGDTEVRICGFSEDDWVSDSIIYNGPIIYLAKKI